jgi:tetratricopeptide (TPR) repeat protein
MKLDPKLFDAPYFFGRARLTQGRPADAVKLFERAATIRPEDYQAPKLISQAYDLMGEKDEASRWQRRAVQIVDERLQLNPDDTRALIFGAGANAALGESERAGEMASQALALDSEDPALLYNVACTFSQIGKLEGCDRRSRASGQQGLRTEGMDRERSGLCAASGKSEV